MGGFHGTIFSRTLKMDIGVSVILPQDSRKHRGVEPLASGIVPRKTSKTLLLLHGLGDNHTAWMNKTGIYRYAEEHDIAVIMPEVHRSFYQNMYYGHAFETFIAEELPQVMGNMFHISTEPEDLMIAGLSMGGYGALYLGLKYPEKFCAIGAFSGAVDIVGLVNAQKAAIDREDLYSPLDTLCAFGPADGRNLEKADVYHWLEEAMKKEVHVPIFLSAGAEDPIYPLTEKFAETLKDKHYAPFVFHTLPGTHDWDVWDTSIQMFLKETLE